MPGLIDPASLKGLLSGAVPGDSAVQDSPGLSLGVKVNITSLAQREHQRIA
jgi:hypothetical protein